MCRAFFTYIVHHWSGRTVQAFLTKIILRNLSQVKAVALADLDPVENVLASVAVAGAHLALEAATAAATELEEK